MNNPYEFNKSFHSLTLSPIAERLVRYLRQFSGLPEFEKGISLRQIYEDAGRQGISTQQVDRAIDEAEDLGQVYETGFTLFKAV